MGGNICRPHDRDREHLYAGRGPADSTLGRRIETHEDLKGPDGTAGRAEHGGGEDAQALALTPGN